jgi:hypothetical protein
MEGLTDPAAASRESFQATKDWIMDQDRVKEGGESGQFCTGGFFK